MGDRGGALIGNTRVKGTHAGTAMFRADKLANTTLSAVNAALAKLDKTEAVTSGNRDARYKNRVQEKTGVDSVRQQLMDKKQQLENGATIRTAARATVTPRSPEQKAKAAATREARKALPRTPEQKQAARERFALKRIGNQGRIDARAAAMARGDGWIMKGVETRQANTIGTKLGAAKLGANYQGLRGMSRLAASGTSVFKNKKVEKKATKLAAERNKILGK